MRLKAEELSNKIGMRVFVKNKNSAPIEGKSINDDKIGKFII